MKVLHLIYDYFPVKGGYCYRSRYLFKAELENKIKPFVAVGPFNTYKPIKEPDLQVYDLHKKPIIPKWIMAYQPNVINHITKEICKIVKKERIDIIHAHDPPLLGICALIAGRKLRIPAIHHFRGLSDISYAINNNLPSFLIPRLLEDKIARKIILKKMPFIVTISNSLKEYFGMKIKNRCFVIPNGVDTDIFKPCQKKRSHEKVLLFAGNARPIEGLELVIKSLIVLDVKFMLISKKNNYVKKLLQLSYKFDVRDKIVHIEYVPHNKIAEYISSADIYVLPRKKNLVSELVTALKPLEPMATKTVVLASDLKANREIISDGENGYLFEPDSVDSFIEKVRYILSKNQTTVKEKAYDYILKNRRWKNIGEKIYKMYNEILGQYN